jgi:hypothetical protein
MLPKEIKAPFAFADENNVIFAPACPVYAIGGIIFLHPYQ